MDYLKASSHIQRLITQKQISSIIKILSLKCAGTFKPKKVLQQQDMRPSLRELFAKPLQKPDLSQPYKHNKAQPDRGNDISKIKDKPQQQHQAEEEPKHILNAKIYENTDKIQKCQNWQKKNQQKSSIATVLKTQSRSKIKEANSIDMDFVTSVQRWSYGDGKTPKKLIIATWNVNGVRAIIAKNMLNPFLRETNPDILCLNQTKIDEKTYDLSPIRILGYEAYWNFPKFAQGYSGVAVFSKFKPLLLTEDFKEKQLSFEGRLLTLHFQDFILVAVYVPMSGKQLERLKYRVQKYDVALRNHLESLQKQNASKMVVICGDLNVAHTALDCHSGKKIESSPSFTREERIGMSELLRLGFKDVYRQMHSEQRIYTWWNSRNHGRDRLGSLGIGRRLDYFLVDEQSFQMVRNCIIHSAIKGSDHCPVTIEIDFRKEPSILNEKS